MATRRRKGSRTRKILIIAGIAFVIYVAMHAKSYVDDQTTLQRYVDTHTTTAPATPGR
jgi:hypothetical protein